MFVYIDGIRFTTGDLSQIFTPEELPLKFEIVSPVSQKTIWATDMGSNMWGSFPENEMKDVVVKDKIGNIIYRYYWKPLKHGSYHYSSLWVYNQKLTSRGITPKGIVIGTHDGEFGEWVPIALEERSKILLVEGSKKQFNTLKENYQNTKGVTVLNTIVTENGGDVEFFEGGKGYTNTVVERVIKSWETEEISSSRNPSISLNDIIENEYQGNFHWLHLDVEGLDAKLIMSIKKDYLPNFIIFEDFNLYPDEKNEIYNWLKEKSYSLHSELGICTASKIY